MTLTDTPSSNLFKMLRDLRGILGGEMSAILDVAGFKAAVEWADMDLKKSISRTDVGAPEGMEQAGYTCNYRRVSVAFRLHVC